MAIHALGLAFIPRARPPRTEPAVVTETVRLAFRPRPAPTPPPSPTPLASRSAPPLARTLPAAVRRASSRPAPHSRYRQHAPERAFATRPTPALRAQPAVATGSESASAGGAGSAGTGDGADVGAAGAGESSGTPCGVVIITELESRYLRDGSHVAKIRLEITLEDGSVIEDDLGWEFAYAHDSDDPFTPAGKTAETPILLQQPPPGYDLKSQKPATVFAVEHTDRRGYTDLRDCPK